MFWVEVSQDDSSHQDKNHKVKWKSLSTLLYAWQNEIVTVCNFSPWGFLTHLYAKYVLMITLAKFQALLGSHSLAVNYCFSIQLMSNLHSVKKWTIFLSHLTIPKLFLLKLTLMLALSKASILLSMSKANLLMTS